MGKASRVEFNKCGHIGAVMVIVRKCDFERQYDVCLYVLMRFSGIVIENKHDADAYLGEEYLS